MKKSLILFTIIFYAIISNAQTSVTPTGSGTSEDPYLIANIDNLYWITQNSDSWAKYFKQTSDIDADVTINWFNGAGWPGIGTSEHVFSGVYDGQNYSITGLYISGGNQKGLFGNVSWDFMNGGLNPEIKNLNLINFNISGGSSVGTLIGYALSAKVTNCHASGSVSGSTFIGGLFGYGPAGISTYNSCSVIVTAGNSGYAGGFSGDLSGGEVNNCFSTGNVYGDGQNKGGFAGRAEWATISNCFSTGDVIGTLNLAGGFIGGTGGNNIISNCFSTAHYSVNGVNAGFTLSGGTITNCFYSTDNWTVSSLGDGTGVTNAQMQTQGTFTNWNFSSIWDISENVNNGFPYLRFQAPVGSYIIVTSPSNSQFIDDNSSVSLQWTSNSVGTVTVELFNGYSWSTIATGVTSEDGSNSYSMTIPAISTTKAKIKITDDSNSLISGESGVFTVTLVKTTPSGSGTSEDPYLITNLNNLYWVIQNSASWNKYFKQTTDIDASSTANWPNGTWTPIGSSGSIFNGVYDGQNYSITGLYISGGNQIGLFGYVDLDWLNPGSYPEIKNLKLINFNISGGNSVGTLIGHAGAVTVTNCHASGSVSGSSSVGGLFGSGPSARTTSNSSSSVIVTGSNGYAGGFSGNLTGGATVNNCFSTGNVYCSGQNIGGFAGSASWATISNCFSTGDVIGTLNLSGGFIGGTGSENTVSNCYSTAHNSVNGVNAGFMMSGGTFNNCFYSSDNWTVSSLGGGTGATNFQLQTQGTFTSWDFTNTWKINSYLNNGYPFLAYQTFYNDSIIVNNVTTTPVVISYSNIGFTAQSGNISLNFVEMNTPPSNLPGESVTINKYWEISDITGGSVKLRLYYLPALTASFTGTPKIIHYNGSSWEVLPTEPYVTDGLLRYVETTNYYSSFSPVTIGDDFSPLPVELATFTASVSDNKVNLSWQTATEVNNYGFQVERREHNAKGMGWKNIGFVNGHGNSNSAKEYSFADNLSNLSNHLILKYRLKQIDNDGSYEFSKIIEVDASKPLHFGLEQNYPNPFNPTTRIKYQVSDKSKVSLKIFDILGKEVTTLVNEEKSPGVYEVKWNAAGFSSGVYFYKMETENYSSLKKLILIK